MQGWQGLIVTVIVALVPAGGVYALLTLGPQRRKLGADAVVQEATAAATLTGSALEMVKHAEQRAASAEAKADHAEQEALEAQHRLSRLIQWIRTQGMNPPAWVEGPRHD